MYYRFTDRHPLQTANHTHQFSSSVTLTFWTNRQLRCDAQRSPWVQNLAIIAQGCSSWHAEIHIEYSHMVKGNLVMPQFAVTVKILRYYRRMVKNDDNTMGMGKIHSNYHCRSNTVVNVMLPLLYAPSTERLMSFSRWEYKTMNWSVNAVQSNSTSARGWTCTPI